MRNPTEQQLEADTTEQTKTKPDTQEAEIQLSRETKPETNGEKPENQEAEIQLSSRKCETRGITTVKNQRPGVQKHRHRIKFTDSRHEA
ncbi:hypothetical protein CEXT_156701 [Caerostris extrusa]|uniref:Uncharacterized protein n=1 Tax=Caerostris extrusa TaxID=172846 RepID=A0AAV4WA09_CAEEX|nr:hypothetical protein CEXT_156701 [Caerostris extrusa]